VNKTLVKKVCSTVARVFKQVPNKVIQQNVNLHVSELRYCQHVDAYFVAYRYTLPEGARPEDVTSNLSSDGVLVVTAKKHNPAIEVKINQQ
jgi:Hsp20/alpha crystallin family